MIPARSKRNDQPKDPRLPPMKPKTPLYLVYGLALCAWVAAASRYGLSPLAFGGPTSLRAFTPGLQHK